MINSRFENPKEIFSSQILLIILPTLVLSDLSTPEYILEASANTRLFGNEELIAPDTCKGIVLHVDAMIRSAADAHTCPGKNICSIFHLSLPKNAA